jgi:two-component system, response regulator YesN
MKIVIVEDEPRIREGLAKIIRKISSDYDIVGEAEDGLEGIRIITEKVPDLVITDVRMPDLDGLEMLYQLGESAVKVKAIVLSAYSEFSYACQAIKLGVSEYLLKPIKVGDLTRSLKNIEDQITAERLSRRQEKELSLEGVLYSIILGGTVVDADLRSTLSRDYRVDAESHCALLTLYLGSGYELDVMRIITRIKIAMTNVSGFEYRVFELPRLSRLMLVAFNIADVESTRNWFDVYFMPRIKEAGPKERCVGWGCFRDFAELKSVMQQVDSCLDWNIVLGGEAMLVWPDVNRTPVVPLSYPIMIESQVRSALCTFERDRYESGIREFMRYMHTDKVYSPKEIKNAFIRFFWSVFNTAREIEYEKYEALEQQDILERITFAVTWTELEGTASILFQLFPRKEGATPGDGSVVRRAKNVVQEFYSQGISLNEVALKISVTSEYLSAQFHRETGTTFSTFIRDYRIQKAKELLIGTNLKLYSIGEQVGYGDSKYFCRVFKEVTGLSPSEYRKANR